jgi:hypothetical protein
MKKFMSDGDTRKAGPAKAGSAKTGPAPGQEDSAKKEAATEEHAETARGRDDAATTGNAREGAGGQEEVGGPQGPEPTRFGDWERKGRCIDF